MGGRLSLLTAASLGARIAIAASFHGGNLANADDPDSPHHKATSARSPMIPKGSTGSRATLSDVRAILQSSASWAAGAPDVA